MRYRSSILAAGAAAACALATPALADVTIIAGNNPGSLDTILLDGDDDGSDPFLAGLSDDGWTVQLQSDENIVASGGPGQAWVVGTLDDGLHFLEVTTPGATFEAAEFKINAPNGPPVPWDITIDAFDSGNLQFSESFTGITNDQFFNVFATNGQTITSVRFTITSNTEVALGQLRLGGIAGVIPEPTTWALMILGFGGAGAMLRRRRPAEARA